MFNFVGELNGIGNLKEYKFINFGGKKVYVQGFKNLLSFNEENIVLKVENAELTITGKTLKIEELGSSSILVCGEIVSVRVD